MKYVVYETATTRYAGRKNKYDSPVFDSVAAAKSHITRLLKNGHYHERSELAFAPASIFHDQIEKKVKRINMMSGNEYEESINTPLCCSPASETYWSM